MCQDQINSVHVVVAKGGVKGNAHAHRDQSTDSMTQLLQEILQHDRGFRQVEDSRITAGGGPGFDSPQRSVVIRLALFGYAARFVYCRSARPGAM